MAQNRSILLAMSFSMLSYLLAGYLLGLTIGFIAFDPNSDVYALLGVLLALIGALIGILPFFRRRSHYVFGAVIGFYIGLLFAIVLFGNAATDDLPEALRRGGIGLVLILIASLTGAVIGGGQHLEEIALPGIGILIGGFLGGYLFVGVLKLVPLSSMINTAPFVLGSAAVVGAVLWKLQRQSVSQTV